MVGASSTILRTTDAGQTWINQASGTTSELLAVSFTDTNQGHASGYDGVILGTTDGGSNWTVEHGHGSTGFFGISFTDVNNGTAVGQGPEALDGSSLNGPQTEEIPGWFRLVG